MPVLTGAANADGPIVLGNIGDDNDLRTTRDAPTFAEDVEFDLTETSRESHVLRCCKMLVAEINDPVLVVGIFNRREGRIVERTRQVDASDLGAKGGSGRNDLTCMGAPAG